MRILFLHGLESTPGGSKVKFLESLGHEVVNPWLPANSFIKSLSIAQTSFDNNEIDVIVGSSRGGALAMALDTENTKTILIAPAWNKREFLRVPDDVDYNVTENTIILHSILDDVVPINDSERLLRKYGCRLHICGDSHRMSDNDALRVLKDVL